MNIIKSDNGFPYAWKAGRVEQLIRNILERKAQQQLSVDRVMLINPFWLMDRDLAQEIYGANPDFIICHNFVDPPIHQVHKIVEDSGHPYIFLGNAAQCRIDFWSMVCDLYFRAYTDAELAMNFEAKKFLCYNRKPHAHRCILVDQLLKSGLQDQGYISLGYTNNALVVDQTFTEDQGIQDALPDCNPIGNDVYSLGDIAVWKNSYLCVVTETVFSTITSENFFISEKTWKPIIGMRPFFVYGQPALRLYLKEQGFDIFEDLINYNSLPDYATEQDYADLLVSTINQIHPTWTPRFQERLNRNRERFHNYVYEQWNKLHCLNLQDYTHE